MYERESVLSPSQIRIGIDLGGTKISAIALDKEGSVQQQLRVPSPREDYDKTIAAVRDVVLHLEKSIKGQARVGIGMPGSISPNTGLAQNANSTWLNGKPFDKDLMKALNRTIRFANDADCFTLSEATDGAGAGKGTVFGVIIGTGCGGGVVIDGKLIHGPKGIAGEWGHNPLPWPTPAELNVTQCWCGLSGCMETWVSGPGLSADHARHTGQRLTGEEVAKAADQGEPAARSSLDRLTSRLARGLASCMNFIDPDTIVLGGGLSQIDSLYSALPDMIAPYLFSDHKQVDIRPPKHGDDSGVRGAAWLWSTSCST